MQVQKPGFGTRVFRSLRNFAYDLAGIENIALKNVSIRLRDILQKHPNIRLNSYMFVRLPEIPSRVSAWWRDAVEGVLRDEFGTNARLVDKVMDVFGDYPEIIEPTLSKIDRLFTDASQKRYDPRKLVPVIYLCLTYQGRIDVPRGPDFLLLVMDEIGKILDEQKDPAEELGLNRYLEDFVKSRCGG